MLSTTAPKPSDQSSSELEHGHEFLKLHAALGCLRRILAPPLREADDIVLADAPAVTPNLVCDLQRDTQQNFQRCTALEYCSASTRLSTRGSHPPPCAIDSMVTQGRVGRRTSGNLQPSRSRQRTHCPGRRRPPFLSPLTLIVSQQFSLYMLYHKPLIERPTTLSREAPSALRLAASEVFGSVWKVVLTVCRM